MYVKYWNVLWNVLRLVFLQKQQPSLTETCVKARVSASVDMCKCVHDMRVPIRMCVCVCVCVCASVSVCAREYLFYVCFLYYFVSMYVCIALECISRHKRANVYTSMRMYFSATSKYVYTRVNVFLFVVQVYMYTDVCMYIHTMSPKIAWSAYVFKNLNTLVCSRMKICTFVSLCIIIYVYKSIYVYIYTNTRTHACMHVHVYERLGTFYSILDPISNTNTKV